MCCQAAWAGASELVFGTAFTNILSGAGDGQGLVPAAEQMAEAGQQLTALPLPFSDASAGC